MSHEEKLKFMNDAAQKFKNGGSVADFELAVGEIIHQTADHAYCYGFLVGASNRVSNIVDTIYLHLKNTFSDYKQKFLF